MNGCSHGQAWNLIPLGMAKGVGVMKGVTEPLSALPERRPFRKSECCGRRWRGI
jgi:hypothetical protein